MTLEQIFEKLKDRKLKVIANELGIDYNVLRGFFIACQKENVNKLIKYLEAK